MPNEPIFPDGARDFVDDDIPADRRPVVSTSGSDAAAPQRDTLPIETRPTPKTVVVAEPMPLPPPASTPGQPPHRGGTFSRMLGAGLGAMIGLALIGLLVVWMLWQFVSGLRPFEETTVDRSGPTVLTAIQDLRTFQAASGYYEVIVDLETEVENLPTALAGERILFVAAGTVDATVDFSVLDEEAITTNTERTEATITLPAPAISKAHLDLDRSYVASHQRGLADRLKDLAGSTGSAIDTKDVYTAAEKKLTAAGQQNGELRQRAEANTRATLTALLGSLGYTKVTVIFTQEP